MGNNTKNIIDINGKRYDAFSGEVVRSIDGFRPAPKTSSAPTLAPSKQVPRTPASHLAPHKPQRAATLMRTAVKKPNLKSNKIVAQSPTDILAIAPTHQVATKLSHSSVNPHREKRAKRVIQSPAVSRYGNISAVDSLAGSQASLAQFTPTSTQLPTKSTLRTPVSLPKDLPVRPISHVMKQSDIFEQALARATSHEQVHHKVKSRKKRGPITTFVTGSLVVLLALGVFAYFNAPQLNMRLASSRAGFEAQLPNYSPAGFSFGNLSYSDGNVSLNYRDGNNEKRSFNITQRVSNWDSEGLLNNFVTSATSAYQTYERAGRTVYFYGDNSATWVDNGIWYTIDGRGSLTKNQVLDMAGSL